jgi:hypothetical protein
MKANTKTLMAVKTFLIDQQEYWDKEGIISEIVTETNLLRHKYMGNNTLSTDECGIEWDGDGICVLSDFVNSFTNIFISKICNVLDSFVEEDIDCYFVEEQ